MRWLVITSTSAMLLLAGTAQASTVNIPRVTYCTDTGTSCRYMDYSYGHELQVAGAPGERNRITVRRDGDSVLVADTGAPLIAGAGCAAVTSLVARCALTMPLVGYRIEGGDQDDELTIDGALKPIFAIGPVRFLSGGAGADRITAGADDDTIAGGPGEDRMSGGGGDDSFFLARPNFDVGDGVSDGAEDDVVDGGPGTDMASYVLRTAPLTIGPAGGGEPGERDRLTSVENITGGKGADHLTGDAADNRLVGGGGNDRLEGGAGDDVLVGGFGSDRLLGGPGDDQLGTGSDFSPVEPDRDQTRCGPGRDSIGTLTPDDFLGDSWEPPGPNDVFALDCERVAFGFPIASGPLPVAAMRPSSRGRRAWVFPNPCRVARMGRCRGRIALAVPGVKAAFAVRRFDERSMVRLPIGATASRRLARSGSVAIRVSAKARKRYSTEASVAYVLALR